MKNIKFIISFCPILILFFLTFNFFESPKNIATFKRYGSPIYKIKSSLLKSSDKNSESYDNDSKKQVIDSVLNIIKYNKWQDYRDYIDIQMYYDYIIPDLPEQLILALNLSKDLGVIVIFEEINGNYIFHSKIENLSPIEKIKFIEHPAKNKKLMMVYQISDEKLGAFSYRHYMQIFDCDSQNSNVVLEKTISGEEIYKENWVDINASDLEWIMVIEESQVNFDYKNTSEINTVTSVKKYRAKSEMIPLKDSFSLIEEKSYKNVYCWSEKYNTFVSDKSAKDVLSGIITSIKQYEN